METDEEYRKEVIYESIRILVEGESAKPNQSRQSIATICMVPNTLRNLNPAAYTPRVVSIGPLHKEDQHLRAIEEQKVAYMYKLFCRRVESTKEDMEQTTRQCAEAMLGLVQRARACYATSFTNYDDFKFAEMVVIDGCFILELLYRFKHGIAEGDSIFDNILVTQDVRHDLLLLENQIPHFILEILFGLTVKRILNSISLTDLLFYFFKDVNIIRSCELITTETIDHCHILGLLQSCYRPRNAMPGQVPTISYSATEIAGAGVKFKECRDEMCPLAVVFKPSSFVPGLSTLFLDTTHFKIPALCINDSTASLLRNLIAYEQCYPLSRLYVTSLAFMMDTLVDTKEDVEMLVRSKVLQYNLGTSEDVTHLFNSICNGVVLKDFYYSYEWAKLDEYCNRFWPRVLILLRRMWKTLSVVAAVILFALTLLQTIYTVGNA